MLTTFRTCEQLVLVDSDHPVLGSGLGREVLAPGNHVHAERPRHRQHRLAEPAEAEQPEGRARQVGADRLLPASRPDRGVLGRQVPDQPEDQRPRQLDRRSGTARSTADHDSVRVGGGDVDRGVAHAGRHDQPEPREPGEQRALERRTFAHRDDDVVGLEAGGEGVLVVEMVAEEGDVGVREARPVGHGRRDALVVVQHRHLRHDRVPPSPIRPSPDNPALAGQPCPRRTTLPSPDDPALAGQPCPRRTTLPSPDDPALAGRPCPSRRTTRPAGRVRPAGPGRSRRRPAAHGCRRRSPRS